MTQRKFAPQFHEPRGINDTLTGFHPRPRYDNVELASLCRWLNERERGYPTVPFIREHDEALLAAVAD